MCGYAVTGAKNAMDYQCADIKAFHHSCVSGVNPMLLCLPMLKLLKRNQEC